jgi:hypothetical protein
MLTVTNSCLLHMQFAFKRQMKKMLYFLKQKVSLSSHNPFALLEFVVFADIVWPLLVVCHFAAGLLDALEWNILTFVVQLFWNQQTVSLKESYLLECDAVWFGRVVPDVSEDCSAFILSADQSKNGLLMVSGKTCIVWRLCFVLAQFITCNSMLVVMTEPDACQDKAWSSQQHEGGGTTNCRSAICVPNVPKGGK